MKKLALALVFSSILPLQSWAQKANYLPLDVGNKWELRSPVTDKPVIFDVIGKAGAAYRVRWDNPWIPAELQFVVSENQVLMQGLDMGEGVFTLPEPLLYFDFAASENANWSNALGKMAVLSQNKTVTSGNKRYERCIEIRITDDKGEHQFWTFAPEVGFVQFGQAEGAFVLSASARPDKSASKPPHPMFIGIDANPPANEHYSPDAVRNSVKKAVNAGKTLMHLAPKWNDLEPRPGQYDFEELDFDISVAEPHSLPIELGVRAPSKSVTLPHGRATEHTTDAQVSSPRVSKG